jgi:4-amino-4-deoxy-L-arabinose transferase-like glycosyltransferase
LALLAWGALGAGILIKGPITPMVVGFCLIALGLWERRWDWMAPLAHWMGPALAGLICLPWLIAIGVETNGAFFAEAITGDLAPKVSAGGEHPFAPPGLHSLLAPLLLFPLAVGLAPGAVLGWKALRAPRISPDFKGERFLLAWALPSFLAFELATTKLAHYPLPTYPALALLCGLGLVRWWDDGRLMLRIAAALMFLVGSLGVIAACALLAGAMPGDEAASARRALQAGLIVGVVMAGAAIAIAASKRLSFALAISVFAALYGLWVLRERTLPEARTLLVSREANVALLRERLHPRLSPEAPGSLYVMGYNEASLVFETRSDVILTSGAKAGADAPVGAAVIAEGRERAAFEAALAGRGLAFEPAGPAVVGHNYSNDDAVTLQPGRVVDAAGR